MSERISSWENIDDEQRQQIAAARQIGSQALRVVDTKYGSGYPLWTPGTHELAYHNGHHGRKVGEGALRVCVALDSDPVEQALAEALGNAHDIIQGTGRGSDERASGDWATAAIRESRVFPAATENAAQLVIAGTEPLFDADFNLVGQKVTELDFPDKATERLALGVASGDLGGLYTPQSPHDSHQLFREIHGDNASIEKLIAFQRKQLALLESYRYPTPKAEHILATHRSEVIAYAEHILAELKAGNVDWHELIRRDEEFMRRHS